ncbi:hypothetical protein BJX99DRAFT_262256 [Aspergillus californicus]
MTYSGMAKHTPRALSPTGGSDGRLFIKNGAGVLYSDLPDNEAQIWESRLTPLSSKVQFTRVTRTAYEYIPSTYLICDKDKAISPRFQEAFAEMANSEVDRCSSGHSPMLSQVGMLAGKIIAVAERAVAAVGA